MPDLIKDLDKAIAEASKTDMLKPLVSLLRRSQIALGKVVEANAAQELSNIRAAWDQYKAFDERLGAVAKHLVKARAPEATCVYVTRWNIFGPKGAERISCEVDYRLYEGPEYDAAYDDGSVRESGGETYLSRKMHLYLESEWLWTDGWKLEAEVRRLEELLGRAKRNMDSWHRAIPDREDAVKKARTSYDAEKASYEKLAKDLQAARLALGLPSDDEDEG
jgi:hypothetical protein